MIRTVLGIDLASSKWSSVGSATIRFDDEANVFTRVNAGAVSWPAIPLTAEALADAIDAFAKRETVCAVAMDGPQGWPDPATVPDRRSGYVILECFPTSAWRSSGLAPLPGKGRKPDLQPYVSSLVAAYRLPDTSVATHDDLQAVVAALTAAAAAGGPAVVDRKGVPGTVLLDRDGSQRRIEGFIWDVKPLSRAKDEDDERTA